MTEILGWGDVSVAALATVTVLLLGLMSIRARGSQQQPQRRLPPGPRGWPILGCIPLLGKLPTRSLYELSKQYGPLMFMHLGSVKTLVVTSPKMAEEILKKHDVVMASRPRQIVATALLYNAIDIGWVPYGSYWRHVKKIVTVGLLTANRINQFREGREREVLAALHFILEESRRGNALNMTECFCAITTNNITQMMMNKSYCVLQSSDSKSKAPPVAMSTSLPATFRELFELLGAFNVADYVPLLRPFDPQGLHKRGKVVHRRLDAFLEAIIKEHRQKPLTTTTENRKEDFVDALLGLEHTDEFEERPSMDVIKVILLDMLVAGGDTSAVTALWALTELMRSPHTMRKAQEELNSVVGPHRLVQEEDLPKLVYLNAVLKETLRLHPAGPLLLPHESTEDVEIEGFHVPAGTKVFVNLWGLHRDPAVWERPLEFDPDRFLNSTVDYKGQHFEFIPFGSGRRMCPGVNLGSLMVLYPLSMLLHALDFTVPEGQKPENLDMSETFGLVLYKSLPLTVFAKSRLPDAVIYGTEEMQR